jgi:hypothetical protein
MLGDLEPTIVCAFLLSTIVSLILGFFLVADLDFDLEESANLFVVETPIPIRLRGGLIGKI